MQFLWKYVDELVGKGLDWKIISELLFYASAGLIPMALPLAVLLSSIMTFGNLGENYELAALKSSGISLPRIMFPLIIFNLIIGISAFWIANNVIPYTNLKMGALLFDVRQQRPEISIKEGVFTGSIDGYSIKVTSKGKKNNMLYGLKIYDHTGNAGNNSITLADSGKISVTSDQTFIIITLFSGESYTEVHDNNQSSNTHPFRRDKFFKQEALVRLSGSNFNRTDEGLFKKHYQMMNLFQLQEAEDSLKQSLSVRKNLFSENMVKSNYFKREGRLKQYMPFNKSDSANKAIAPFIIYKNLSLEERTRSLQMAVSYANNSKSFIESTGNELFNRTKLIRRHQIEWHRKFALSFACFVMFFIGAPLGAIIRKGGLGMPVVVSVLFFILYYIISLTGEKFVREGVWPAFQGMWLSSFILLPLGIFLTYKASMDSIIMNFEPIIDFFNKLSQFNFKLKKTKN
jgi:lipopolysaccharide export system permease protein